MKKTIIAAGDSEDFHNLVKAIFSETHNVHCASSIDEAFDILESYTVHLIISTVTLQGSIVNFISKMRGMDKRMREIPYIMLSNDISSELITTAHDYNIEIIKLPFEPISFISKVDETLIRNAQNYEKPDPLTGLHKKQYAEEQIIELLSESKKGALLLISIDRYKFASSSINDSDLITCRDIITGIISKDAILAISNSHDFILFVPNLKDKKETEDYAMNIVDAFSKKKENLYISIGLASTARHGTEYPDLYQQCDLGLNIARTTGKNTACFYSW